jgi:hypothetical protein
MKLSRKVKIIICILIEIQMIIEKTDMRGFFHLGVVEQDTIKNCIICPVVPWIFLPRLNMLYLP